MSDATPSDYEQRRHLLPRWPPDPVVIGLLVVGGAVAWIAGVDLVYGLIPGSIAGMTQHVSGHVRAWRMGGVEKAFVMESSAVAFYVVVVMLIIAAGLQMAGVFDIEIYWLAIVALYVDTLSRSVHERRFA